jgi:hypothetical protein
MRTPPTRDSVLYRVSVRVVFQFCVHLLHKSRDTSVGIVATLQARWRGNGSSILDMGLRPLSSHSFQIGSRSHPTSYPMGAGVSFPRDKAELDRSPPTSAEVKNAWSYTSTPPLVFKAWWLIKRKDNSTFVYWLYFQIFIIFLIWFSTVQLLTVLEYLFSTDWVLFVSPYFCFYFNIVT